MNIEELQKIKKITKLNIYQQEKDYYQYKILSYLSEEQDLIFKGGTALQKAYGLPRFSEDLDFNSLKTNVKEKMKKLVNWLNTMGENTILKNENTSETSYSARLVIEGILFRKNPKGLCGIEIDISFRETTILKPNTIELAPQYSDIRPFLFQVMNLQEITAEKIRAIMTRNKARDLYDLHFLLCKKNVELDWNLVQTKLNLYNLKTNPQELEEKMSAYAKTWKNELKPLLQTTPDFEQTLNEIKTKLEKKENKK